MELQENYGATVLAKCYNPIEEFLGKEKSNVESVILSCICKRLRGRRNELKNKNMFKRMEELKHFKDKESQLKIRRGYSRI